MVLHFIHVADAEIVKVNQKKDILIYLIIIFKEDLLIQALGLHLI